ncbi:MAG: hypothetical protein DSZ32_05830 [Gammaproteobacteria bacterium]|nr:MAG: hypothetical protein DSZ32_05830 [Gammaproteobacteria bacterium]
MKKMTVMAPLAAAVLMATQPATLQAQDDASFVDAVRNKVRSMFDDSAAADSSTGTETAVPKTETVAPATENANPESNAGATAQAGMKQEKVMTYEQAVKAAEANKAAPAVAGAANPSVQTGAETAAVANEAAKTTENAVKEESSPTSDHWSWSNWGKKPGGEASKKDDSDRSKMQADFEQKRKQYQAEMDARSESDSRIPAQMAAERDKERSEEQTRHQAEMARRDEQVKQMRAEREKILAEENARRDAERAKRMERVKNLRAQRDAYAEQQKARYAEQKKAYEAEVAKRKEAIKQRALQEKQSLQEQLKKDPKNPALYGKMGQLLGFMGDRDGARKMFEASRLVSKERFIDQRLQLIKGDSGRCAPDQRTKSMAERLAKELEEIRTRLQALMSGS